MAPPRASGALPHVFSRASYMGLAALSYFGYFSALRLQFESPVFCLRER